MLSLLSNTSTTYPYSHFTVSGTAALIFALRTCGINKENNVLLPGYHCPKMVQAVLAIGANPILVDVTESLSYDLDCLSKALDSGVDAVVLVHYFAKPDPLVKEVAEICNSRGIYLIEDCAHCDIDLHGSLYGNYGSVATYSLRKFYPVPEGGLACFINASHPADVVMDLPILRDELRSIYHWLETSFRGMRRPQAVTPQHNGGTELDVAANIPGNGISISLSDVSRSGTCTARMLWKGCNPEQARLVRKNNYQRLSGLLGDIRGIKPFELDLPETATPYVLPAVLDMPDKHYPALKYTGVPVWRWDQLYQSQCSRSFALGNSLIQLPIHQDLSADDIDRLAELIQTALIQ